MPIFGALIPVVLGIFHAFVARILEILSFNPLDDFLDGLLYSESLTYALKWVNWICPIDMLAVILSATGAVFGVAVVLQAIAKLLMATPKIAAEVAADAVVPEVP